MNEIWVSFIVFFLANGATTLLPAGAFPTLMNCQQLAQKAEPGGAIYETVRDTKGSEITAVMAECMTGSQAADREFLQDLLNRHIPASHRRVKGEAEV